MSPIILFFVPSALAAGFCQVVDPGSAAFIRNSYVELGLGNDGAFGEGGYPSGWHYRSNSNQLGFVANPQRNSWASFYGDFFSPGSPLEAWGVEFNGISHVNANNGAMGIPGSINDPACEIDICGNLGGAVDWSGQVGDLKVGTQYGVVNDALYIVMTVTLENVGASTLSDVYWFRNVDPDNAVMNGGGYATTNTILAQPSAIANLASVKAAGSDGSDLYLLAADARARVTHGGFYNADASDIWSGFGFSSTVGASANADQAISLAVRVGDLSPGQKETFRVLYTLDETAVGEATDCASAPLESDADGDGIPDATDICPADPMDDADADGICGDLDICPGFDDAANEDEDELPDGCDSCPLDPMNDIDEDDICGDIDVCPFIEDDQRDLDGDGDGDACDVDADADGREGEADCDDLNAAINDPQTWYMDEDGDGYGNVDAPVSACSQPLATSTVIGDCDDMAPMSYPLAFELEDGVDQNCNGKIDDGTEAYDDDGDGYSEHDGDCSDEDAHIGLPLVWYRDRDEDDYGDSGLLIIACDGPVGYVNAKDDCDDRSREVHPGAIESCYADRDLNCDGSFGSMDADADKWFACEECDDSNPLNHPGAAELCDAQDNDCDGAIDEGCPVDTVDTSITETGSSDSNSDGDSDNHTGIHTDEHTDAPVDSDGVVDSEPLVTPECPPEPEEISWTGGWSCGTPLPTGNERLLLLTFVLISNRRKRG